MMLLFPVFLRWNVLQTRKLLQQQLPCLEDVPTKKDGKKKHHWLRKTHLILLKKNDIPQLYPTEFYRSRVTPLIAGEDCNIKSKEHCLRLIVYSQQLHCIMI